MFPAQLVTRLISKIRSPPWSGQSTWCLLNFLHFLQTLHFQSIYIVPGTVSISWMILCKLLGWKQQMNNPINKSINASNSLKILIVFKKIESVCAFWFLISVLTSNLKINVDHFLILPTTIFSEDSSSMR